MKQQIHVIVKATNSEFWQMLLEGARAAQKDFGDLFQVVLHGPKEETEVTQQVEILEEVLKTSPSAIVIASTSNDLTVPAVERAMSRNIPVITIDNRISTEHISSFIATDNGKAAAMAAADMAEKLMKDRENTRDKAVVVINSLKESKVDYDRDWGFIYKIKACLPELNILEIQYIENSARRTEDTVMALIKEHRELIGIFADNDQTGIGVARAVQNTGMNGKLLAYAFDSSTEEIAAVREGALTGIIVQKPFEMGYQGVVSAWKALNGESIDKNLSMSAVLVKKENLDDTEIKKLLNI